MDYGRGRGPGYGDDDGRGPGYGYYPRDSSSSSRTASGQSLPVWALVLIMVASGLVTLTFLWLCVLVICRKRRARRAAVRDLEGQTAWAAERDANAPAYVGEKDVELKRCEANNVELTYVVMAGEDQPSFLARPAANVEEAAPTLDESPKTNNNKEVPLSSPPTDDEEAPLPVNPQKSPPSPSR